MVGLLGIAGLAGCSNPGYFVCTLDSECTEAQGGRCEPSGACSIPDATCPTGRRYGELGNPDIAGQCVPADEIGSTGADPTAGEGTGSSGTGDQASSSAASGSTDGSTGDGSAADTTSGSTAAMSSSSGGGVVPDLWADCETRADCAELCAPVSDPATLDPLGHWCTGFVCDDPAVDCTDPGTGAIPDCLTLEFGGRLAPRCILDCTESGTAGCPEGMECFEVFMSVSRCAHPVSGGG